MQSGFINIALVTMLSTVLASCASIAPPVRPDYPGADQVTVASAGQMVGSWTVTDLNPYPNTEPQATVIEYRRDGTVTGSVTPTGESADALGNLSFQLTGNWTLEGDTIRHSNISMKSSADNVMGSIMAKMLNTSTQGISGEANIYELSDSRIVMVGTDGAAMRYDRQ